MKRKFARRNFLKLGCTSQDCPFFLKFRIMLFHSLLEISNTSNPKFLSGEKHSISFCHIFSTLGTRAMIGQFSGPYSILQSAKI